LKISLYILYLGIRKIIGWFLDLLDSGSNYFHRHPYLSGITYSRIFAHAHEEMQGKSGREAADMMMERGGKTEE